MSILSRMKTTGESRSGLANPDQWLTEAIGGNRVFSGQVVNTTTALELVPVYSAVSLLAGAVGSLPLLVYRKLEEGRERATNHRTWKLLHDQPNPEMAADEMWEMLTAHLCLWGNGFLAKQRDSLGNVGELWPLRPNRVQVGRDPDGQRYFLVDGSDRYTEQDILHIRGLGMDGLIGLSPIQQARQMIGGALSQVEYGGSVWENGGVPIGILRHPNKLSPEAADRIASRWKSLNNSSKGRTAVLEEGMEYQQVQLPMEDAQFMETAKFTNLQVALLFRVPPVMLGAETGGSMDYTNTEMQGIDFVRWSLRRWLVRIESSLLRDPSLFVQGTRFYPEFLVDGLLRASTKDRYEAYAIALEKGFLTKDEVRDLENRAPLKDDEGLEEEPPVVPLTNPDAPPLVTSANGHG